MDEQVIGDDPPATYIGCLMTTWHAKESLVEAVDFFLACTIPDEEYAPPGCRHGLAVAVGSTEWATEIGIKSAHRRRLRKEPIVSDMPVYRPVTEVALLQRRATAPVKKRSAANNNYHEWPEESLESGSARGQARRG